MTQGIKHLVDDFGMAINNRLTNGEILAARAALEQATQAQADELERLRSIASDAQGNLNELCDVKNAEIERLTAESAMHSRVAQKAIDDVVELKAKLNAATKVPLTEEQIFAALDADIEAIADAKADTESWETIVNMVRAIEAAHNIKGTTP